MTLFDMAVFMLTCIGLGVVLITLATGLARSLGRGGSSELGDWSAWGQTYLLFGLFAGSAAMAVLVLVLPP